MSTIKNEAPFRHLCRHGLEVKAERCDLRGKVELIAHNPNLSLEHLLSDVAQFAGWHAANILPELNGFAGYDCLNLVLIHPKDMVLKTPREWEQEFDYTILDPDGWRDSGIPFDQKISRMLFQKLARASTITKPQAALKA